MAKSWCFGSEHLLFSLDAVKHLRKSLQLGLDILCGNSDTNLPAASIRSSWENLGNSTVRDTT